MTANTTRRCLVVTGTRRGHSRVAEMLDAWVAQHGEPDVLILGDADGVDMQAWAWACKRGSNEITCQHIAEWGRFGNAAGPKRNAAMIAHAGPCADLLAFPDALSKGTWDCVKQASAAGLRVHVVPMELAGKGGAR